MKRYVSVVALLILTTSCVTWRSKLDADNHEEACLLADEISDDGLHRAALARISREYSDDQRRTAVVTPVDAFAVPELAKSFDREQFRVVQLRSNAPVVLFAIQDGGHVWLPFREPEARAGAILAVGMELSERPAPIAQSAAEAADRSVRKLSKRLVDPALRRRDFGAFPYCPDEAGNCKARRRAFRELEAMLAPTDCLGETCEQTILLRRAWETLADFPAARVRVNWDLAQCPVHHFTDISLGETSSLGEEWMAFDAPLTQCTLEDFAPDRCQAPLPELD